ncbi:hypothetical protein GCM10017783_24610 [Deinococcus piscis]|uniref:NlpC/P60 domain-containing protein n=1 Tax=Deinococcus piscis TaxID=394230 RepID=A0ABQ3KAN8_9DEIO|nr:hypothetical protein [Deinococcus piscis]GHG11351.1 hypothetical protein GCM10017783_24610 [Deinococcus piscis]
MQILNIPALSPQLEVWRGLLAAARQPFFLTPGQAEELPGLTTEAARTLQLTPEERDTYTVWAIDPAADRAVWLTVRQWEALPAKQQKDLLRFQVRNGRGNVPLGQQFQDIAPELPRGRFLWRPAQLSPAVLTRLMEQLSVPCQRDQMPERVWQQAHAKLPRARKLAGTFPQGSAGNCFGTVMAAAGVVGAEGEWIQREPFEAFLRERAVAGGHDAEAGTVLVWRSTRGVEHAAVTLGEGWGLQKAAQTWWTPRTVLPVADIKRLNCTPGWRLERWHLRGVAERC